MIEKGTWHATVLLRSNVGGLLSRCLLIVETRSARTATTAMRALGHRSALHVLIQLHQRASTATAERWCCCYRMQWWQRCPSRIGIASAWMVHKPTHPAGKVRRETRRECAATPAMPELKQTDRGRRCLFAALAVPVLDRCAPKCGLCGLAACLHDGRPWRCASFIFCPVWACAERAAT